MIVLPETIQGLEQRSRRPILQVDIQTGAKLVDRIDEVLASRVARARVCPECGEVSLLPSADLMTWCVCGAELRPPKRARISMTDGEGQCED